MSEIGRNKVSEQEIYDYLMTKPGMTDVKAKGILANIKAESAFYSDAVEIGDMENKGIGLFQHTFPARKQAFIEAVPDWKTNWKGQIDFALQEQEAQNYMKTDYETVSDSTRAFMLEFEKPADQSEEAINKRVAGLNNIEIASNPVEPLQPQVLDAEGNVVDQPTDEEGEFALREEEERQRQEEDEAERPAIIKRGEDAKEYQKLIKRNKTLRAAYPTGMPAVFSREIRNNKERMSEIEQEYNLTRPTDEEYEDRRLEIVNNIISADDDNPTPSEEDLIDDALEEVEDIEEEEEFETSVETQNVDDVSNNTSTPQPTLEDVQRRHGSDANINDLNGVPHVVYTDENGESKQYRLDEFNSEENLQKYRLQDRDGMPPAEPLPIEDQPTRQDNTAGPTITPVESQIEEVEDVEAIDPTFIPNQESSSETEVSGGTPAPDVDGDGVPDSIDPDSRTVEVVDTDFTNNQTNNETVSFMDNLGDIGNVLQQGLGIVNNIRQNINNQDDLVMSALGKKAYAEAMKEIKPVEYEGLSDMFKQHLNQVRELSKMGFSPDEKQRARAEIDAAYGKGIENAVRGTAGDRAKFLAMSGVLDSQRQSALLDFAAKDAELNRANMDKYTKALSFSEQYNLTKSKAERAEELQLELQKKKGASDFAGKVFQSLQERAEARRLAPLVNMYKSSLLQGMTTGHTDLSTPNIVTNNNNQGQ
jgi:hypothetical protein